MSSHQRSIEFSQSIIAGWLSLKESAVSSGFLIDFFAYALRGSARPLF